MLAVEKATCGTQIQSEIPMIYFVLDSGWFFEDLLFQLQQNYCNSPLQTIAFFGSLAVILQHILIWARIPSIYLKILSTSRSRVLYLMYCNGTGNFTAMIILKFSGMQQ